MISTKMSELEKKEDSQVSVLMDTPDYPYGLELQVEADLFRKLNITEAPEIGEEYTMLAKVKVSSVRAEKTALGQGFCASLQIVEMDLKEIEEPNEMEDAAEKIYGKG